MFRKFFAIIGIIAAFAALALAQDKERGRESLIALVAQIQRADYEGDRSALKRLREQLEPFLRNKQLVARVKYWQAFALWRRALNGFNESADSRELQSDLERALNDFDASSTADPKFADAKIGAGSCLSNLVFLNRDNATQMKELITRANDMLKQARTEAPDNPRLYWVLGPNLWYAPPERGGSQTGAIELYKKGLDLISNEKAHSTDPLEPSWGEPELLMNLAWSNLHKSMPDLSAAQSYARSALKLVPYWHYVRDILLPQINHAVDSGAGTHEQAAVARRLVSRTIGEPRATRPEFSWLTVLLQLGVLGFGSFQDGDVGVGKRRGECHGMKRSPSSSRI